MKIEQLREQTIEELARRANELKHEMLNMRIQQASGQLENPARMKLLRREVARIETIISERRLNLSVGKKLQASSEEGSEGAAAPAKKIAKKAGAKKSAAKKASARKAAKKSTSTTAAE